MAADAAVAEPEAPEESPAEPQQETGIDDVDREHGQEVERFTGGSILTPARYGFDPKQVEAIRRTVAKECNDAELVMFLEVAARYELDPFAKHIFAAKIKGAVQIIVSRDGLLHHAQRQGEEFVGLSGDVIHARDEFDVEYQNGQRTVRHKWGIGFGEDGELIDRGPIVGAWAEVRRARREPTFFFAPFSEYERSGDTPWKHHPTAMILKVAETYALRKAFSVSGVVGEEEIDRQRAQLTATPDATIDWGDNDDPELGARLRDLVEQANTVVPGSYRPAKVRGLLDGADREQREKLANEIADFIASNEPEPVVAEPEPVDAEVVEDDDPNEPKEA